MRYSEIFKKYQKDNYCPFCNEKSENMIEKGKYCYVIPARAPYTKDHLLVIPKRHVNMMTELSPAETKEMYTLVDKRAKKLHTTHKNVNLLLRDGLVQNKICNKSVDHLHFHLLPSIGIHIESIEKADNRKRIEYEAYTKLSKSIQKRFLAKKSINEK